MPVVRAVAPLLFVLSGAVALGLEVVWFRRMVPVFGATHTVSGLLLAVYMAGLALGAALGAAITARAKRPLLAYALCEGAVALSSALTLPALAFIERSIAPQSLLSCAAMAALVLAVPTTAMGATTPLLLRALSDEGLSFRRSLATLYGANLFGAAIGALATGFVLLPSMGLRAAHTLWTSLGLAIAALALLADRSLTTESLIEEEIPHESQEIPSSSERALAALSLLVVGCASFALQVSLGRVASLLLGSTAYTFELLAAVVLVALAVGGLRSSGADDERFPWATASSRALRVAVAVFLAMLVVRVVPSYVQAAVRRGSSTGSARLLVLIALAAWPYYEIGALFPLLASRVRVRSAGASAGLASTLATVGNVGGALLAAFVTIPHFGVQWTLRALALSALSLSVLMTVRTDRTRRVSTLVAASLAIALALWLDRPWDAASLSAGTFRTALNRSLGQRSNEACAPGRRLSDTRVLFHRDGALGTVAVLSYSDGARCTLYGLRVNGKTEGSVFVAEAPSPRGAASVPQSQWLPVGDLPSERLVGAVVERLFVGRRAGPSLVVGWGTGISNAALLRATDGPLYGTEIEPAVLDAARLFDRSLFENPRVHVLRDDARRVLRAMPERSLDAIVSHPSNPWVTGATTLFSREFFTLVRSRLRDGGRVVAWVQLYEIDLEGVRSLVRTFTEVFPDAIALRTSARARDLFLVGPRGGPSLDGSAIESALRSDALFRELRVVANGASLRRFSAGAEVITDDNALLEFRVADVMLSGREDPRVLALQGLLKHRDVAVAAVYVYAARACWTGPAVAPRRRLAPRGERHVVAAAVLDLGAGVARVQNALVLRLSVAALHERAIFVRGAAIQTAVRHVEQRDNRIGGGRVLRWWIRRSAPRRGEENDAPE